MKLTDDLFHRRQVLIAQIDSQRMELGQAYRQLEKPIHYGEMALQGFGFLRKNPWVAMAAPGVTGLLFSGLGYLLRRGKPKAEVSQIDHEKLLKALKAEEAKAKKPLMKYLGYGLQAFKLYRRVRPFFL
jgi:hypothetical protein